MCRCQRDYAASVNVIMPIAVPAWLEFGATDHMACLIHITFAIRYLVAQ